MAFGEGWGGRSELGGASLNMTSKGTSDRVFNMYWVDLGGGAL